MLGSAQTTNFPSAPTRGISYVLGVPGIRKEKTGTMRLTCLLLLAISLPLATVGCGGHRYRTYDPYYNDYHRWDDHERVY